MPTFLFYLGVVIFLAGGAGSLLGWPKQPAALSLICAGTGFTVIASYLRSNQHGEDNEEVNQDR